jgi:trehalose/maltose hydrolase-like predicted phosphorylase
MTSSIEAIVAARLGRGQQSLDLFHDSYQPFMRAPWDAFSEKRTTNNVYFLTGMAGCVQSVLYGFAGLQAVSPWEQGTGQKIAGDSDGALYCDPHLPPGWNGLVLKGVRFRGKTLDVTVQTGNKVTVRSVTGTP